LTDLTDGEYKTAVQTLEVFRMQREMRFDTAYKVPFPDKTQTRRIIFFLDKPRGSTFFPLTQDFLLRL